MFKAQLNNKEERLKNAAQQAEFDRRATQNVSGDHYEARGGNYNEDAEFEHYEREQMYYLGSQFEYGGGSGNGGISSVGSTLTAGAMDRSGPIPSGPQIGRSSSMRAPQTQSRGGSRGSLRGFFSNLGASGRKTNVNISDLDPRAFPPSSAKEQHIDDMYGKPKKWELGKAISKWFHFSRIPANAVNNPYYRTMVSTIQNAGPGPLLQLQLQFRTEAPILRKIATRILSQTTSSSGCERNWSTFSLIHTKPCNRLSYTRLEKLAYVHYNMRLRMRILENEEIQHVDPFDVEFVQGDADPIIDWWSAMESDQPLLDEPGDRPSPIISNALGSESQPEDMAITSLDSQRIRQARRRSKSDSPSSQSKGKKKATPSKAKGKAKEVEEDEEDEPFVHSSSSTEDGGDDDDDGAGGEDIVVPSTLPPDDLWTNEQYFDHATQDDDHDARIGQTTQVYKKRGPCRGGGPTALQDYHHYMMSSLQEVSESTYSVSSTYSTDDTGSSSWNLNKETLMSM
ncbi:hypothetical protein Cni_G14434 [Canna indica]|uniref:HAT C-terminal dimerisation domain-containing protein n=1 Tax=Canna indica TaxID=4628 RepID=A0AAQ3KE83_9LILI|nr:hypothetical protein Cni_G14434 [Canna indica]